MVTETLHPDVYVEETPGVPRLTGVAASTPGLIGRAKKGPTDRATLVTGMTQFKERYGDYPGTSFGYLYSVAEGFFEEGGRRFWAARAVGAGAAKANGTLTAYGVGPVAGSVLSGNSAPFDLEPGQDIRILFDALPLTTVTFAATRATRPGGAPTLPPAASSTLLLRIDGGSVQTVTFAGTEATIADVALAINAQITDGFAAVNGANVDISSDTRGTGSSVQITGGTALVAIGHTVGTTTGTGDVANIDAVTVAEAVAKINPVIAGIGTASPDGTKLRLTSDTTGAASSVQVTVASTAVGFGFDNLVHSGSNAATVNALTVNAQNEGAWGNDLLAVPTRYSTKTTTATVVNTATSATLESIRGVERGDLLLFVDPANSNFTIVHVYAINPATKVVSFRPCALSIPATPLAIGTVVSCSTQHRRVTELASAVLSTAIDLPLKQAFGIVEGANLTIDDGTNFAEVKVVGVNGNTVRINAAIGTAFAANVMVASQEFYLKIFEAGQLKETHQFLAMDEDNVQDYVGKRLAGDSNESQFRIEVVDLFPSPTPLFHRAPRPQSLALSGGMDGAALTAGDLIGDESAPSGMHLFDKITDINRFSAPGYTDAAWIAAGAAYAEGAAHKGAITFYYDAPLEADTVEELLNYRRFTTNLDTSFALLYSPWLKQRDPKNSKGLILVPPTGRVLGRVSDVIQRRGVHVAAANVTLRNVLGLSVEITDGQQDLLNQDGVNVIRFFPGQGIRIWGARTNQSLQDGLHYQNVRELLNFVKLSFIEGMRFAVFEPNDPRLWRAIERTGQSFLSNMWRQGQLFPSDDESRAYFVKCDDETNTLETRAAGQVIAEVGVNAPFPAEFVVFRIGVWDGGSSIEEEISRRG